MGTIGTVIVSDGGTLSGTGTVGNVTVDRGGILSPGDNGGDADRNSATAAVHCYRKALLPEAQAFPFSYLKEQQKAFWNHDLSQY